MNSRERVRKTLEHKIPDRMPIDLGSMRSTSISTIAYNNLRKELRINNNRKARMYDFIQQLAYPEQEVMDRFHIDVIDAGQGFLKSDRQWKNWNLNDGSKCLIPDFLNIETDENDTVYLLHEDGTRLGKEPKTSLYVDQCYWVYGDLPAIPNRFNDKDLDKHMWAAPSPPWHLNIFDENQNKEFIRGIKELYENTEYAIVLGVGCNLFEVGTWLRGMENFLVDIYADKKGTIRLLNALVERNLIKLERVIKGVGKYVDLLQFSDDLGGEDQPFISPEIYDEVFKPMHKKMWDFVHDNSDCKVFLHICGSIFKLLPGLIDAGVDVINPVQTTSKNMEPERLKKEFGKDIIFWGGGCNTRDVLGEGTLKQVREDVKKRVDVLADKGGMVFNQIHNILANVPPENVISMFDAAYEFGKY